MGWTGREKTWAPVHGLRPYFPERCFANAAAPFHSQAMNQRIPEDKKAIHATIAARLEAFGAEHLDEELTGYVLELWERI